MSPPNTHAILSLATFLLPHTTPPTTLTHATDLVALITHATLVSLGFRLDPPTQPHTDTAEQETGEEEEDDDAATVVADDPPEPQGLPFTSLGVTEDVAARSRLPEGWNAGGEDSYTFTYRHAQSQLSFVVKVGRMGSRVCVSGMAEVCPVFAVVVKGADGCLGWGTGSVLRGA